MTNLIDLYEYAQSRGIGVYWFELGCAESLSYCDAAGECYVAMDPWRLHTVEEEKTKLGHELGHCCTGSFYNRWAACDVRRKHENRADKWAITHLSLRKHWTRPWPTATQSFGTWRSTLALPRILCAKRFAGTPTVTWL